MTTTTTTTCTTAARPEAGLDDDRRLLLRIVEEAYRQSTWNGTNLRSSLEHVSAGQAGWRPPHAKHSIAEIVLHSAYWKFAIRKRLTGDRTAKFPYEGKDWFDVDRRLGDNEWSDLIAVLDDEHKKLTSAIRRSERGLQFQTREGRELVRKLFGVAMHDAYHTGQVHLIQAQHGRAHETTAS